MKPASRSIASGWLAILAIGCTAHGEVEEPPPPARSWALAESGESVEVQVEEEPPSPEPFACVRHGPISPLRHKPHHGAIGDVTGDGQPDVVALSYVDGPNSALVVLEGRPDGSFAEGEPLPVSGGGIELGDLDGDGDLDALILDARRAPAYRIADNDGTGTFTVGPPSRIPGRFGGELNQASLVDLDRDGDLDAVVPLWDSLRVLTNRGGGRFTPGQRLIVGRDPSTTAVADFDDDGYLDLISTSGAEVEHTRDAYHGAGSVWFHQGSARGFRAPQWAEVPGAETVIIADLDLNGQLDLAVSRAWGLTVLPNPGYWELEERGKGKKSKGPTAKPRPRSRFQVGTDGTLLAADLGPPFGLELLTSSYMLGSLQIASESPDQPTASIEAGSFVVGLYGADVSRDDTLPDVVLLNAGPPGGTWGEPAPSIGVLFVDCAAP